MTAADFRNLAAMRPDRLSTLFVRPIAQDGGGASRGEVFRPFAGPGRLAEEPLTMGVVRGTGNDERVQESDE